MMVDGKHRSNIIIIIITITAYVLNTSPSAAPVTWSTVLTPDELSFKDKVLVSSLVAVVYSM
jgi:hypothetical protein